MLSQVRKQIFFKAVLVDMEEGVINELLRGPMRELFDSKQKVTDVSGSGNNWYWSCLFHCIIYAFQNLS